MSLSNLSNLSHLIRTKAIYEPAEKEDGARFLVVRFPKNIGRNHYLQWVPDVSPSPQLLKSFKERKITWKAFYGKYIQEMSTSQAAHKRIHWFRGLIQQRQKITFLCYEAEFRQDCHRHILKRLVLGTEAESVPDSHLSMSNAELVSYVPKPKNEEKQATLDEELLKITRDPPPHCYYCLYDKFTSKEQYERHVLLKHPKKLCYPGTSDLELLGIQGQNMPWEI